MGKQIRFGIGFTTGRKSFRKVLKAHMHIWQSSLQAAFPDQDVSLRLFVAYDLEYRNTISTDYTNLPQEIVDAFDDIVFLGVKNATRSLERLNQSSSFTAAELRSIFGKGYAGKRNAVLYAALDNQVDYLLFLDDDEYPMAVTNNHGRCLWSGQDVLLSHLREIPKADYTNGYHCGYISPIPSVQFGEALGEADFRSFIGAISNDIISWEKIKHLMQAGGVTYADTEVLIRNESREVLEENGCKFISGANLCINLTKPERTLPFYNPPGARGEDTFLSTLLRDRTVQQIPCYAFHDGFAVYHHLLDGVLPTRLAPVSTAAKSIVTRFHAACVGWVRYKPLLVLLTNPQGFDREMADIRLALQQTLPKLAAYFQAEQFLGILEEFESYCKSAPRHQKQFLLTQSVWARLMQLLAG